MKKYQTSRLRRKEEKRSLRQAIIFGFLTLLVSLGLVFLGIPIMIRVAIFLSDLRSSSQPIENQDIFPPSPPRLEPLPEATNSAQIEINGFAEQNTSIEIFVNDFSAKKVMVENDGKFKASDIKLKEGENEISLTATDKAGNVSQKSKVNLFFDQTPPELEISEPTEETVVSGEEGKITLKGKTEEKASLTVNDHLVIVNFEGNFEYPLPLNEGENQIIVIATDKAGNQTKKEIKITYSP